MRRNTKHMKSINNKAYCDHCNDMVEYVVKEEKNTITVRGTSFEVIEHIPYCKKCGKSLWINEIEKDNEINVYDIYKQKVGLLTSKEIYDIRKKRGMSQKQLADFLYIGEKDITRYENGAIQSKAIDTMIRMVGDDDIFANMNRLRSKHNYKFVSKNVMLQKNETKVS